MNRPLRILFVAQAVSIHTARWIRQLQGLGWDLHLFDMHGSFPHAELGGVTEYSLLFPRRLPPPKDPPSYGPKVFLRLGWDPFPLSLVGYVLRRAFRDRVGTLTNLIGKLRPDVIHSFELQTQGYHLLEVDNRLGGNLGAPWIVNTWGSDIFYFQQFPEHEGKIRALLQKCEYLIPDCARDESLARSLGFQGKIPLILPGAGGYPLGEMRRRRAVGPVSQRRLIMLKGYQGWAGRAMTALEALESCAGELDSYEIIVYAASKVVAERVDELRRSGRLHIRVLGRSPHSEMLDLFGRARLAIGVNATDGVPNAMLEAMTMGAFPIQSDTESTAEWIDDGRNGFLIRAGRVDAIADAIRRALDNDALVDRAADYNSAMMDRRLDLKVVRPNVIEMYEEVASRGARG